jgi:prepilin-type N-terminal cleavage/methylation domain-containing protein
MHSNKKQSKKHFGFTLLEMSMVMVIFGLMMGGLMVPIAGQMKVKKIKDTQRQLELIKESLYGFMLGNTRLPCPANSAGNEDRTGNRCRNYRGNIPWADLGLDNQDAWLTDFIYMVDPDFTDTNVVTPPKEFNLCGEGNIQIFSSYGKANTTAAKNGGDGNVAKKIPVIIFSSGENGDNRKNNLDEKENYADNNRRFVSHDLETGYDDLITWIPTTILKNRAAKSGVMSSLTNPCP